MLENGEKRSVESYDLQKEQMLSFYQEHGLDGWILKCDIRKFFYRIDHEILKDIVDYYFPDTYTKWLNGVFIDSTESPGLPLGNQVAQIYALLMLNGIDHMVTGELGISRYGRYMDDLYLMHHDKKYLKECLDSIQAMTETLHLELNGKTKIVPFKNGIKFLGFHHYITKDGRYIQKLPGEKKRHARKKLRRMAKAVRKGKMPEEKMQQSYQSWKSHALKGNCIKLCCAMDEVLKDEK